MKKAVGAYLIFWSVALTMYSCSDDTPPPADEPNLEVYAGGMNFTTFVGGENAFGVQSDALEREQSRLFVAGNSLFRSNWVSAPASVASLDGIGPLFNAISCGSCHFKDGRAAPPGEFAVDRSGLLFRLSIGNDPMDGSPLPHPVYGGQIQDKSLPSAAYEAQFDIDYEEMPGTYPDGESYSLQKPKYSFTDWQFGTITESYNISPRIAPQLVGLGLLESIDEGEILAYADENDADNDGISGRPNYVYDREEESLTIGRFGWKANEPNIKQQNAGAFNGDMGLTSSLFPDDDWTDPQESVYPDIPNGGLPEVTDEQIFRITLYVQSLAVPASRDVDTEQFKNGKALFRQVGCDGCHIPSFTTSTGNDIAALDNQKIAPYTDLLLHDMGEGLADHRRDYRASGTEWKTAPLWGIGLVPSVNNHSRYLHDGRARSIEEAILWHGGESEATTQAFKNLSKQERADLIFFVKSL